MIETAVRGGISRCPGPFPGSRIRCGEGIPRPAKGTPEMTHAEVSRGEWKEDPFHLQAENLPKSAKNLMRARTPHGVGLGAAGCWGCSSRGHVACLAPAASAPPRPPGEALGPAARKPERPGLPGVRPGRVGRELAGSTLPTTPGQTFRRGFRMYHPIPDSIFLNTA